MAKPECQWCGREFGNEGAKTTHEASCDDKPEAEPQPRQSEPQPRNTQQPQQQQRQQPPQQPAQGAQANQQGQPPARQQDTAQGQQSGELANMSAEDSVATGMQMGSLLAGTSSGDPGQQAEAKGKLLQAAAGALSKVGQSVAQQGQEQHQRAQQNAGRQTTSTSEYPECCECGGALTQLPPEADQGQPFPCNHCGAMLEFE